jgi:hypothetical protein
MDHFELPEPAPPLPPASRRVQGAVRARFVLLGCYVVLSLAWYYTFLSGSDPLGFGVAPGWSTYALGTLVLFATQFFLLLGAPHLRWPRPRQKRSIFISLAAGSVIALLLSAGVFWAGTSLYRLIFDPASFRTTGWLGPTTVPTTTAGVPATPANSASNVPWTLIGVAIVGWTFWLLIFAFLGAGQWTHRFRRMYRTLIAGTILELLITIPIDVQVRKRTDCYCGGGTFLSLAIGLTAILWTFGPGVAILFLIRRNQRMAGGGCCLLCGYDLRGLDSARCPECGAPFSRKNGTVMFKP